MLVIIVETNETTVTFRLDGRLAGAAVAELALRWFVVALHRARQAVLIDLARVTAIDVAGGAFLAHASGHGARLIGREGADVSTDALCNGFATGVAAAKS